jgi:hypothetical protein
MTRATSGVVAAAVLSTIIFASSAVISRSRRLSRIRAILLRPRPAVVEDRRRALRSAVVPDESVKNEEVSEV